MSLLSYYHVVGDGCVQGSEFYMKNHSHMEFILVVAVSLQDY